MAVIGYAAQGTVPKATQGAQVRKPITGGTTASPVVLHVVGHGMNSQDTVEVEGMGGLTASGSTESTFQITVVDADHISLNGSSGSGSYTSGGYVIDYQLQPALQIPSPADPASMVTLGPCIQGNANPAPYLYRRAGKWRLYNEYTVLGGNTLLTPYHSNPWSNQTGISSGGAFTKLQNGQFSLQSMSDTISIAPYFGTNEWMEWSVTLTVGYLLSDSSALGTHVFIGAALGTGTGVPSFLVGPFVGFTATSTLTAFTPITITGSGLQSWQSTLLNLTLCYYIDYIPAGSISLDCVGPLTGWVKQYRQN